MAKPLVTVLIDTYNHERFIEEAIASVFTQDFPAAEMEVLVVDDGSTDATPEIIRKFEPRLTYIRKENGGQASAFNFGIPRARGEIIAFLDGDDWWAPTKLGCVTAAFRGEPTVGLVGHGITEAYSGGEQHTEVLLEGHRFRLNSMESARLFRRRKSFLGTSRMALRTQLAKAIVPVPEELRFEADEYIFTLAATTADVRILPESLTYYRVHGASLYQAAQGTGDGLRRKQEIMARLARLLDRELRARGFSSSVVRCVVESIQAEADQMRLTLDGGYPWETVRAEWNAYKTAKWPASPAYRVFKIASLLGALLVPPRAYYRIRNRLAANRTYLKARRRWAPIPQPEHVARSWNTGPQS